MKARIHKIGADGTDQPVSELFDGPEAARIWLVEQLRLEKLTGDVKDFILRPYDDEGHLIEKVPDADAKKAAEDADYLVHNDQTIARLLNAMITARQLYVVAATELSKYIVEAKVKDGDVTRPPTNFTMDLLIQSAAYRASEPFDETIVYRSMHQQVMPWFNKLVETTMAAERAAHAEAVKAFDAKRRAAPVDVAFSVEKDGPTQIAKTTMVVLGGHREGIRHLIRKSIEAAVLKPCPVVGARTVVWLTTDDVKPSKDDDVHLLKVPLKLWEDCARTTTAWPKFVQGVLVPQLSAMPDLIVIDDLLQCNGGLHGDSRKAMLAADAQKIISTWCRDVSGAAVLAAIPAADDQPISFVGYEWERLRSFTTVRPVAMAAHPSDALKSIITVGRDAFELVVDTAAVTPKSPIIIPG